MRKPTVVKILRHPRATSVLRGRLNRSITGGVLSRVVVLTLLTILGGIDFAAPSHAEESTVPLISDNPTPDLHSVIRNPSMGWVLYVEGKPPRADDYWRSVAPYIGTASILYFRVPWAYLEPKEGQYAWDTDRNFQALIQGARERGLQVAFRVVTNSKDNYFPGTPDYVKAIGADGYLEDPAKQETWNPSLVDPVFRAAFAKFVDAFGQKFDDPDQVAFVDGGGVGWWGEMHHLHLNPDQRADTYDWLCSTYAHAFHHVLLGTQINSELSDAGLNDNKIAFGKYGYVARIDSLGSFWFGKGSRDELQKIAGQIPFYGESCYFSLREWDSWKNSRSGFQQPRDVLEATMKDALANHANTLDLREPNDAATWFAVAPDLVRRFVEEGGYRLMPTSISVEPNLADTTGRNFLVHQEWQNSGLGFLPNDNPRWAEKYRVAFALFPMDSKTPTEIIVDSQVDPASWKGHSETEQTSPVNFRAAAGTYRLAVAVVDTTRKNQPAITLAIKGETKGPSWHNLGEITIP